MIRGLFTFSLLFSFYIIQAQTFFVFKDYCKKNDINIITGDSIPKGFAIVGTSSFKKSEMGTDLKELSKKQESKIRQFGKAFKVCTMFVDYKAIISLADKEGSITNDRAISYFALARISACK